jgi:uncharacterized protein (DUF1800 family)
MKMDRREVLKLGLAGAGLAALGGCSQLASSYSGQDDQPLPLPLGDVQPEARLLNRLGFGHRPGDVARLAVMGHEAFVHEQLAAEQKEDVRLDLLLSGLEIFSMSGDESEDIHIEQILFELQRADLLCAVYGRNQLFERMTDFWLNHFNIYALKTNSAFRLAGDTRKVIRANALGKFPDMLRASAHSPAMLGYLDNTANKRGVPNENYARELMELHTLGVHGGYSQHDVMEVARCLTGWTVEDRFLHPRGKFRFDPEVHDADSKLVLGHVIPAGGYQEDGETVLDILAKHPSTARHLSTKLCREFLGKEDGAWIGRMSAAYLASGGDLREMLRPLLTSQDLLTAPPIAKRPLDYVASALRACNADTDCGHAVVNQVSKMGQGPKLWPMPDGYPDKADAWTGSMLGRWNFAIALTSGRIDGTSIAADQLGNPIEGILARHAGKDDLVAAHVAGLSPAQALCVCLASPEFQWR